MQGLRKSLMTFETALQDTRTIVEEGEMIPLTLDNVNKALEGNRHILHFNSCLAYSVPLDE
jgi:hypothetical protein